MQLRGQIVLSLAIGIFSLPGSPLLHCSGPVTLTIASLFPPLVVMITSLAALTLLHALPVSHVMIPLLLGDLNLFPVMILASSRTSPVFTSPTFKHTEATGWVLWSLSLT